VKDQSSGVINNSGVAFLLDVNDFAGQFLTVDVDAHDFLSLMPRLRAATKGFVPQVIYGCE